MRTPAEPPITEYVCPGESSAISRAVHLGRMSRFYPPCRGCRHRDDTGVLSRRQVERLVETRRRDERAPLFHAEGAAGVIANELDPAVARRLGVALGIALRGRREHTAESPVVVIAGDGRPSAPELVAAAGEGLRWAGCELIDVGEASAACLAFSVDHLDADGGLLVGNPSGLPHTAGLTFWGKSASPLSAGGALDGLQAIFEARVDRPTRRFGSIRRFSAESPYLAGFAEHYHALRPLRLVVASHSAAVFRYLEKLTAAVACRVERCRARGTASRCSSQAALQVRESKAHFAAVVDDDGQRCRLLDEQGRPVADQRLLLLLAGYLLDSRPEGAIVLEQDAPPRLAAEITRRGGRVAPAGASRAEMHAAMQCGEAILGGGPSGRIWYRSVTGHASADALWTLTFLVELLSRSDRPLSEVLDAEAPLR